MSARPALPSHRAPQNLLSLAGGQLQEGWAHFSGCFSAIGFFAMNGLRQLPARLVQMCRISLTKVYCVTAGGMIGFMVVRILIVDDDEELTSLLTELLTREGFRVECQNDGRRGLAAALNGGFDLLVLDVMLPGLDGFEILRRVRREARLPILMLTARGEDEDRIIGLELGADDYLPKPFNTRELVARIRAILRRLEQRDPGGRLEINGIAIDPGTREVKREGAGVEVTTFEFDILETLMRSAGRVVSRDELMEELYGRKATPFDRSVDMHISHLRKKLEGDKPLIKTVRGVGYQFVRSPEEGLAA
jgi:two-component system response regulator CpxR